MDFDLFDFGNLLTGERLDLGALVIGEGMGVVEEAKTVSKLAPKVSKVRPRSHLQGVPLIVRLRGQVSASPQAT